MRSMISWQLYGRCEGGPHGHHGLEQPADAGTTAAHLWPPMKQRGRSGRWNQLARLR
jgi:hypothetical protein